MNITQILVYMSECLLGDGLSSLLTHKHGFQVNQCVPNDIHIVKAIEQMQPQVVILNQDHEETNQFVLSQILGLQMDLKVLVVNSEDNFMHVIDHKFHQVKKAADIFTMTQPT